MYLPTHESLHLTTQASMSSCFLVSSLNERVGFFFKVIDSKWKVVCMCVFWVKGITQNGWQLKWNVKQNLAVYIWNRYGHFRRTSLLWWCFVSVKFVHHYIVILLDIMDSVVWLLRKYPYLVMTCFYTERIAYKSSEVKFLS